MLQAVTSLGLSECAPCKYPGDCNIGCVSAAATSSEKIFMELEILSPDELIDWME